MTSSVGMIKFPTEWKNTRYFLLIPSFWLVNSPTESPWATIIIPNWTKVIKIPWFQSPPTSHLGSGFLAGIPGSWQVMLWYSFHSLRHLDENTDAANVYGLSQPLMIFDLLHPFVCFSTLVGWAETNTSACHLGGHRTGGFAAAARVTLCFSSAKHTMLTFMFNYSFTNNHSHEWAQALCPVQPRFTGSPWAGSCTDLLLRLHLIGFKSLLRCRRCVLMEVSCSALDICSSGRWLLNLGPSCCSCDASGPVDAADLWLLMLCWSIICSLELPSVATEHRVYDK